MILTQT